MILIFGCKYNNYWEKVQKKVEKFVRFKLLSYIRTEI